MPAPYFLLLILFFFFLLVDLGNDLIDMPSVFHCCIQFECQLRCTADIKHLG